MEFLVQLISTPIRSPLVEEVYGSHLSMDLPDNGRRRLSGQWKSRRRHPLGQTCGTVRSRRAWMDDGRARPSCLQNGCTLLVKEGRPLMGANLAIEGHASEICTRAMFAHIFYECGAYQV
ncbi:hypothetical protein ACQJBY_004240 [Aegilops geniculata]